jgi:hypothetical protein
MLSVLQYIRHVRAMGTKHSFLLTFMHVHVLRLVPVPPSHGVTESSGFLREMFIRETLIDASCIEEKTAVMVQVVELGSACSESPQHFIHSRIMTGCLHYIWRRF